MRRYGTIKIHFQELLERSGLSQTKFCQRAELQQPQFKQYSNSTVTRLDIDVLARICTVLDCDISELLEFVPPESETPENRE